MPCYAVFNVSACIMIDPILVFSLPQHLPGLFGDVGILGLAASGFNSFLRDLANVNA